MPKGPRGEKRPAEAGVTDKLMGMEDIVALIDADAPKPEPRGPYKKRAASRSRALRSLINS